MRAQSQPPLTSRTTVSLRWFFRISSDEPRWSDIYSHTNQFLSVGLPRKGCDLDWGTLQLRQLLKRLAAKVYLPTMLPESETTSSSLREECLGDFSQCHLRLLCLVVLCFTLTFKSQSFFFFSETGFFKLWPNGQIWPFVLL